MGAAPPSKRQMKRQTRAHPLHQKGEPHRLARVRHPHPHPQGEVESNLNFTLEPFPLTSPLPALIHPLLVPRYRASCHCQHATANTFLLTTPSPYSPPPFPHHHSPPSISTPPPFVRRKKQRAPSGKFTLLDASSVIVHTPSHRMKQLESWLDRHMPDMFKNA